MKRTGIFIAAFALALAAWGYTPPVHNATFTTNGITYAQRGGLGTADFVVTNIDAEAVGKVKSVNTKVGDVVLSASDVHARPDDWMPTASDVGAVAVGVNGGVAIGYSTTASGDYSHAEGGGTTASRNYSHAEGYNTTASGFASHAEGVSTEALGDSSHAGGTGTTASGNSSHAAGVFANANETYSFSWNGDESTTYNSHGVGTFNLNPLGGLSGLWIGEKTLATIISEWVTNKADKATTLSGYGITDALRDDVESLTNSAAFKNAVAKVSPPTILPSKWAFGDVTNANGEAVTAAEVGARPDDWMPNAQDVGAVAVQANGGVAIGVDTTASGYSSHAEGYSTIASGNYSHAEGTYTTASGYSSHAEGVGTIASGYYSHAEGVGTTANENYSFSWNGDESTTYNSHGIGTFNLNPLGGLSGLWIGGQSLATILGGYANSYLTTYAPTNALVSLNQSVQYVTADSNGSAVEILAPTNSMKDWVVYIYSTTNNAVLFPTGTVYAADATVTNALKPNVVTALYLSSYPAVPNGLIVGRQEMNPVVIVR